jgi:hypothetical protein
MVDVDLDRVYDAQFIKLVIIGVVALAVLAYYKLTGKI